MNAKHISIIVAATALLAGCAKSPIEEVKPSEQLADLELSYVGATETKAAIDGATFPTDGKIGLFLFKDEAATTPYGESGYANIKYSYNSTKGKWTADPSIKVGSTPGYLYGYYPYKADTQEQPINVKAIPVESSLNGDDVMYATPVKDVTDQTATQTAITMNHALARVAIKVVNNGYTGEAKLSKIKLEGAEIAPSGTLNATDGSISAKKSSVTLDIPTANQAITAGGTTYECLLVPSDAISTRQDLDLTLTIDGEDKTATLSGENGVIITQNTKSNITIGLSNKGISVQTVSVEDWNVVEAGGHKVTVKLDEGQLPMSADDIIFTPRKTEDGKVVVEAFSKSQKRLKCYMEGDASCEMTTNQFYQYQPSCEDKIVFVSHIFTISDISTDITATIGYPRPTEISLILSNHTTYVGCQFKLSATVLPDDAANKNFTWSSSNSSVATVDEDGRVTPKTVGTANIKATTEVGGLTATCSVAVKSAEELILSNEFSVGPAESPKTVRFSRGNLKYTPSIESWCFFDNQYDQGHNQSQLSLFSWGYGSWSTVWNTSEYQSGNFTDWGNQVGDGNTWRTLSADEWMYLLDSREGNRFAKAMVHEMRGLLIFPDGYELPSGYTSDGGTGMSKVNAKDEEFPSINIPDEIWPEMDATGVAFLPAAGFGDPVGMPEELKNVGGEGCYWSSTPSLAVNDAHYTGFYYGDVRPTSNESRYKAYSVRLVTEVK